MLHLHLRRFWGLLDLLCVCTYELVNSSAPICRYLEMSSSIASRRLLQEYKSLSESPPDGIVAGPKKEEDLLHWEALIPGPEGTPYEGGVFVADITFPPDYPLVPFKMKFLGDSVYHPNGECCLLRQGFLSLSHSLTHSSGITQYIRAATSAYLFYIHLGMIRITMNPPQNDGVPS